MNYQQVINIYNRNGILMPFIKIFNQIEMGKQNDA